MADLNQLAQGLDSTVPVYWRDSYRKEQSSRILKIAPDEKHSYYLILDGTIFHPKGGGQPSDRGFIQGPDFNLQVKKVMFAHGATVIVHWGKLVEGDGVKPGPVTSSIDWDWRYLLMRRHSTAHLLDHCLGEAVGMKLEALDSWLGDDQCYVAYKGQAPSREQLDEAERIENQIIKEDRPVHSEELSIEETRRRYPNMDILPSLKTVRLVSVEECSPIPCGGTHLKSMGEAKGVKLDRLESTGPDSYKVHFHLA